MDGYLKRLIVCDIEMVDRLIADQLNTVAEAEEFLETMKEARGKILEVPDKGERLERLYGTESSLKDYMLKKTTR